MVPTSNLGSWHGHWYHDPHNKPHCYTGCEKHCFFWHIYSNDSVGHWMPLNEQLLHPDLWTLEKHVEQSPSITIHHHPSPPTNLLHVWFLNSHQDRWDFVFPGQMGLWCCDQQPLDFVDIPMGSCESQAKSGWNSEIWESPDFFLRKLHNKQCTWPDGSKPGAPGGQDQWLLRGRCRVAGLLLDDVRIESVTSVHCARYCHCDPCGLRKSERSMLRLSQFEDHHNHAEIY